MSSELSGIDLARQALAAAREMMMTERGMVAPAVGSSVLAQFGDILAAAAPELAGHVQAVAFDADTGSLDIVPDAPRTARSCAGARRN